MRAGRSRGAGGWSPALLAVALAVFVLVTADVLAGGPLTALDRVISREVRSTGLPGAGWGRPWQRELDQLVNFGDREVVGSIVLLTLGWICWRARTVLPLLRLAVLAVVTVATVYGLKVAIGRPAPSGVHDVTEMLRSYPSGHTATAVVMWGVLAAVVAEHPDVGVSRRVAGVLSWLGPLLTMVGMLLRDYHWLTDLLGAAAVVVVLLQVERLALAHWRRVRRGSRLDGGAAEAAEAAGASGAAGAAGADPGRAYGARAAGGVPGAERSAGVGRGG